MNTSTLQIEGMTCSHCLAAVQQALIKVQGVTAVDVDLSQGQATVSHADNLSQESLTRPVEEAGYSARVVSQG